MSAQLTYYLHTGAVVGTAAVDRFALSARRGANGDLGRWTKVQGLELEWEVVGYTAGGPDRLAIRPRRKVRTLPSDCSHCVAGAGVAFVDDGGSGLIIHGWPPCNGRRCIALNHGWEKLLTALAAEGRGSIRIV